MSDYTEKKAELLEVLESIKSEIDSLEVDLQRHPDDRELSRDLSHLQDALDEINDRFCSGRYGYGEDSIAQQIDELGGEAEGIAARYDSEYTDKQQVFVRDLLPTEYAEKLFHYNGRCFASGPAVRLENMGEVHEVIRLTSCPLSMDNMGLGYVLYVG